MGRAGNCPECNCDENTVGASGQKIGIFQIVKDEDVNAFSINTLEILLENEQIIITPKGRKEI